MSEEKIVYGVPFSQPVRSVLWLLLIKKMPFELKLINPGSSSEGGSRHPDYLKKFPTGTIPSYEEPNSGFFLSESHAILSYLCDKHGWQDFYPVNLEDRARVMNNDIVKIDLLISQHLELKPDLERVARAENFVEDGSIDARRD